MQVFLFMGRGRLSHGTENSKIRTQNPEVNPKESKQA